MTYINIAVRCYDRALSVMRSFRVLRGALLNPVPLQYEINHKKRAIISIWSFVIREATPATNRQGDLGNGARKHTSPPSLKLRGLDPSQWAATMQV